MTTYKGFTIKEESKSFGSFAYTNFNVYRADGTWAYTGANTLADAQAWIDSLRSVAVANPTPNRERR